MKYAEVLPSDFTIPSSAFWLISDLKGRNPFEDGILEAEAVVMDCGAFCGTFAAACLEQGAGHVTCYEAAPKNAAVLRENMQPYRERVTVINAALVASWDPTVNLALSNFTGANSIVVKPGQKKFVRVAAVNFRSELLRLNPTTVKIDVEGAEYELLETLRPGDLACVTCLFIEFHPIADRERRITQIQRFIEGEQLTVVSARKRGFTAVRDVRDLFTEVDA